jgi:VWFA-related protein
MRTALVIASCLATTAALHATQDAAPQAPPTFRSGVQLIEVDVTVRDQKGRLVRDLTAADFELLEDGMPQRIASFQLVDLPVQIRPREEAQQQSKVEVDVTSNASSGRVYVMLLDNPPGVPYTHVYLTQRSARRFVTEALAPDDLAAVIDLHSGEGSHAFTKSPQRLLAAIDRYGQAALGGVPPLFGPESRLGPLGAYETMQYVAERLGSVGNRRKAIVWFGGVVPFHHGDAATAVAYRDAVRTATRNNVAIYPVDPHGLTTTLGRAELERVSALRAAAEDTGGHAVVNTNNFGGGYRRIVEENSTYYVIGYSPPSMRQDGRFHDIRVRVKRPATSVRARRGYFAPTPDAVAAAQKPLPEGLSRAATDALRRVVPLDDVAIDAFAAPFMGNEGRGSVLLGARLDGSGLRLGTGDRIEISQIAFDIDGKVHAGTRKVFTFEGAPGVTAPDGAVRYFDRLDLAPGRHEIRLVVDQPDGRTGSVVTHVDVPDFAGTPVALSGIVVASQRDGMQRTLLPDRTATAALAAEPTISRRFTRDDVIALWAEAYDSRKGASGPLRVTTRVASAGGRPVLERERMITARDAAAPTRVLEYRERLELAALPPGSYVLAIEAASADGAARATRQMPFEIE